MNKITNGEFMKLILTLITLAFITPGAFAAPPEFKDKIEQGKYYFEAAGCMNCHSPDRNKPLSGGKKMMTDFGVFYTPNISSDKTFGIGNWTDAQFLKAVKRGISPNGNYYYPSFSFAAYAKMTDEDVLAIRAYMNSLPPVALENKNHEIKFPMDQRKILFAWRALNFRKSEHVTDGERAVFKYQGTFIPVDGQSKEWNRGAYLVESTLHCTECHTPRNKIGGLETKMWMAGAPYNEENKIASNITSDKETGLGKWTKEEWKSFLQDGSKPEGDDVGGEMYNIIKYGTAKLSDSDLDDVVLYLQSLRPISNSLK
jgi:mono/diheme cytochrome c family protein